MNQNSKESHFPKYVVGFLIVSFLLATPLLLKIYKRSLEPYPAVMLPSGEWVVKREGNQAYYNAIELLAVKMGSDSLERISLEDFLYPLPPHMITPLANKEFGLKHAENRSPREVDALKGWLRTRLDKLGYVSDSLTIHKTDIIINTGTGQILNRNVNYGKTLKLY